MITRETWTETEPRTGWTWRQAHAVSAELDRADKDMLHRLVQLPFLTVALAARLLGWSVRTANHCLDRLSERGLFGWLPTALRPGRSPRLAYLTDAGLAVVALEHGRDIRDLARCFRLRRADVLARLPDMVPLLGPYDLLAAVASARPTRPTLLAWQRPWLGQVHLPTVASAIPAHLPAYAALAWDGGCAEVWLVPDQAAYPLALDRQRLDHLARWRRSHLTTITLVVGTTTPSRATAWEAMMAEAMRRHDAPPLPTLVTTWESVAQSHAPFADLALRPLDEVSHLTQGIADVRAAGSMRSPHVPILVGNPGSPARPPTAQARLGQVTLDLAWVDDDLLDRVAHHPFLTEEDLTTLMGWGPAWTRQQVARLQRWGLLRRLSVEEVSAPVAAQGVVEVTRVGAQLVAARRGLDLATAISVLGLSGGGPREPFGARRKLRHRLTRTLAVNRAAVDLYRLAEGRRAEGHDEAIEQWTRHARFGHHHVHPEGYGAYRLDGKVFEFFLVWVDRDLHRRHLTRKFGGYATYIAERRFEGVSERMPTVLVVAPTEGLEGRIRRHARQVSQERSVVLPVLTTTLDRLDASTNDDGLLGEIWQPLATEGGCRMSWIHVQYSCQTMGTS